MFYGVPKTGMVSGLYWDASQVPVATGVVVALVLLVALLILSIVLLLRSPERGLSRGGSLQGDSWFRRLHEPTLAADTGGATPEATERQQDEASLIRRNQELALLYRVGQSFASSLDVAEVLRVLLEEMRKLLDVAACSIWLLDGEKGDLVCHHATGPGNEVVRGWRLAIDEGIAGWVVQNRQSLIVEDARVDNRHYRELDRLTGLDSRSILSVPLLVREQVLGVLQLTDTTPSRFAPRELELTESLVATAAIALENARLYEQARRDAEAKATLLREVNHRVKNNLAAIIGLLYAERRHIRRQGREACKSLLEGLIGRVQSLATVHGMLSAVGWSPLLLGDLADRVIRSSLRLLPEDKPAQVDVWPSEVRLLPDQAHNLGMVINELVTNTVKHASRDLDAVHISARVAVEEGKNGKWVQFEYRDDGPGYPQGVLGQDGQSTGLELIQRIVVETMRGELALRNDAGAVASIRFPAMP